MNVGIASTPSGFIEEKSGAESAGIFFDIGASCWGAHENVRL